MTTSIPIGELPVPEDRVRRDQYGRYKVLAPGSTKPEGYTRVTTIAKVLDEGGGLISWKAAMAVIGAIRRRGLHAQWETLLAEHVDPWYDSPESKARCKALVEESAAAGGAEDRREVGTSLHAITALVDSGQTPAHLTDETKADIATYRAGMAAAGVAIVPGAVELCTVLDGVKVAGTFDRLVTVPGFELPLIADLKTGANLTYSWNSIAVQLAAYAHGDALYEQGAAEDGSQDVRTPMPAVDQRWALVMHLSADQGGAAVLELHFVDIVAGWKAFQASLWTRDWRKTDPSRPLAGFTAPTALETALSASVDAATAARTFCAPCGENFTVASWDARHTDEQGLDVHEECCPRCAGTGMTPETYARRLKLQARIDYIGGDDFAREALVNCWPKNILPLRATTEHSAAQLDVIDELLGDIEQAHRLLATPDERHDARVADVVDLFAGSTIEP